MNSPDTSGLRGDRDRAPLRVTAGLSLRLAEVGALAARDFIHSERRLAATREGNGTGNQVIALSGKAADAIVGHLPASDHDGDLACPRFSRADRRPGHKGERLTLDGLFCIVERAGAAVGVSGLTPHKLRHSSITLALNATNGDVRKVQRLSRHADIRTLQVYDDNRSDLQGEVTGILAGLL